MLNLVIFSEEEANRAGVMLHSVINKTQFIHNLKSSQSAARTSVKEKKLIYRTFTKVLFTTKYSGHSLNRTLKTVKHNYNVLSFGNKENVYLNVYSNIRLNLFLLLLKSNDRHNWVKNDVTDCAFE